ncbi:MAG: glycerophosphodiester phosphodiesterase family protein [Chloroflexota bacterium]|nr:glycerophosphodiester phosphodiesterase family protein [Chloroflexota bacterium]
MSGTTSQSPDTASLEALLTLPQDAGAQGLAARYAPIIRFDQQEPFMPLAAGYTIFRDDADSPSFPRRVELYPPDRAGAVLAIEYAIWWDWDIGHLYELEHIWVFVDGDGQVVRGEASWHGGYHSMALDGRLTLEDDHLVVYSEPGKHAFAPEPGWFLQRRPAREVAEQTRRLAGVGGVWVTPLFEAELTRLRTPYANTLVRTFLQRQVFEPARQSGQAFPITSQVLVPWPALADWIPRRVACRIDRLAATVPPEDLHFLRIAHRGASAHAPENTLAAFRRAAELGANAVELDVRVSADGVPVVIHDPVVSRLGASGAVSELSLDQLKTLDAGNGETIPTLEEAIGCCMEERLIPYIELEAGAAIQPVVEAIQRYELHHWAIVGSFRADWVAAVKFFDSTIATSILFDAPSVDPVKLAQAVGADYVHPCWESLVPEPHRLLTPEWIARVRQAGLGILLWHEERPTEIAQLRRLGVDGICSDAPELL